MIETEKTLLRPLKPEDCERVFAYRSDPETNRFQGWVPVNLKDVQEFISRNPDEFNIPGTWFQLVIVTKDQEEIIGDIGIHFMDKENLQCEIGCTLSKEYHGGGFATEVMTATLNYLFKKLQKHRVTASVDPGNIRSIKLVERLGFRREGHFKESLFFHGRWVDDMVYAILRREWCETQNTMPGTDINYRDDKD